MARLKKFVTHRKLERPYTRKSKYKHKSFIKISPHIKIVRFDMGNKKDRFAYRMDLISKDNLQIRQEAIEAARQSANKLLEKKYGKMGYHFKILKYPHHVLRENPMATGAGADRISTGMQLSFVKPKDVAARVFKGDVICSIYFNRNPDIAKTALKRFSYKIPCSVSIIETKIE